MKKIMLFREFNEFSDGGHIDWGFISARLDEINDVIGNMKGEGGEIVYSWEKKGDVGVVVNVVRGDMSKSYDYDVDAGIVRMSSNGTEETKKVDSIEHGLSLIEDDLNSVIDITGSTGAQGSPALTERAKAQRYKGHKIPGKYLTKNPGKMKKEIETFRGKKQYKQDWDADYASGKGGEGKRVKTKKSAATKAYQKMYGDKEK